MNRLPIGVDIGGTKLLLVAGQQTLRTETGPSFTPEDLAAQLESFLTANRISPSGIGIAVPGLVDASGRVVACDVLPELTGWRPAETLAALDAPVVALNDVEAALREEMHDAPEDCTGGVVMAGTAIGAAFLAHGQVLRGASGWAGELGYLPFPTAGGVRRLDEVAGGAALAARLGVDAATLARRAAEGDAEALTAIREGGEALGIGLAAVLHLLNPSRLAVGGGALQLNGYWSAALRSAEANTLPEIWRDCTLAPVRAGENVAALGARRAAA